MPREFFEFDFESFGGADIGAAAAEQKLSIVRVFTKLTEVREVVNKHSKAIRQLVTGLQNLTSRVELLEREARFR